MLTDLAIKAAQPKDKQFKLADGQGLYLLIKKAGKYWRWDYKFQDKRKTLALGVYPRVKAKAAREKMIAARELIESGIDPAQHKKEMKKLKVDVDKNSFENVALEWFLKNKGGWSAKHTQTVESRLLNHVFPWLGKKPIMNIEAPELLSVLRRIEASGAVETAHRTKSICGQVFRYGIATGMCKRDVSVDLKGALTPSISKHMATITDPKEIGLLLRSIDGYNGFHVTRCAFKLLPLVFVRTKELQGTEWQEIDLEKAEWKIPAKRMKKRRIHIVPLARQAIEILKDIQPLTGHLKYVFPSAKTDVRPISENTLLSGLRRMGYTGEEMSIHGFRAMASTLLYENEFPSHLVEMQLAHAEGNSVKAAYNHAQYLKERRVMLQWWADYLDGLKA